MNNMVFVDPVNECIVASLSLGRNVDLDNTSATIENALHEPSQFPVLIFRMNDQKLFANGKLVSLGTKTKKGVIESIEQL